MTQAVLVEHPHYAVLPSQSVQEEQDANLAFANSIANYLSRLNEDEVICLNQFDLEKNVGFLDLYPIMFRLCSNIFELRSLTYLVLVKMFELIM